jgi:hypothetical protein
VVVGVASKLHVRATALVAALAEPLLELHVGTRRDSERTVPRCAPALDLRERAVVGKAEDAVEEERLGLGADRERCPLVELEHGEIELLDDVGRRRGEEVEDGRQLDPFELVHAASVRTASRTCRHAVTSAPCPT